MTERDLFLAALDIDDLEDRARYLTEQCGADEAKLHRLQKLLLAKSAAGDFLEQPPSGLPPAEVADTFGEPAATGSIRPALSTEAAGTVIAGRYKLRQQIGQGGMGTVWMADQAEPVKRKVAVKLIKPGMDSKSVLARFEAERQALAMMDHPNIAKVFDGGMTAEGRPFFVMEFVKGVPFTEYCDQALLSLKERLNLFTPVCQAVQHAHQKGIIHRDLKPSNILICLYDGKPVPKVIDFGLAKAMHQSLTEQSLHTAFGMMVGTPLYMSPEQAENNNLDVDTRTDIYSLGVILYELLTGSTPLERQQLKKAANNEILRLIKEVDPPKPSTRLSGSVSLPSIAALRSIDPKQLSKSLAGDLDWIVMKALDKERSRRYETANGLARDVERFLHDEAVEACPPTTAYRLKKFIHRNRLQVIAASLLLLALVGGVVGTTVGLFEARRQELKAVAAAQAERDAKQEAEAKRMETEKSLAYAKKGNEILDLVFQSLDPAKNYATVAELRNDLKANLIEATRQLENAPIGDPRVVADMQARLGITLMNLGEEGIAIRLHEQSLESTLADLGDDHDDTNDCRGNLGLAYLRVERHEHALPLLEKAVASARKVNGLDHESTLRHMNNLAGGYVDSGRPEKALPLFQEVLQRRQALLGPTHTDTLASMKNLVVGLVRAKQHEEALSLCLKTVELMTSEYGENDLRTLLCRFDLATCYVKLGQADQAKEIQKQIIRPLTANLGANHRDVILLMKNLAEGEQKDPGDISPILALETTLENQRIKPGTTHADTLSTMQSLAETYRLRKEYDKAQLLCIELVQLRKSVDGPDHSSTLSSMNILALSYGEAGQLDKALPLLEEILSLTKDKFGPDHLNTLVSMNNLAEGYVDAGQFDKALPLHQETLLLMKDKLPPDDPNTLVSMNNVAVCYWSMKQLDQSVPRFEQLLTLREKTLGRPHQETQMTVANLGVNYKDAGRVAEAVPLLEEAYQASKKFPSVRWVGQQLLDAYVKASKPAEARKLIDELLIGARKSLPKDSPQLASELARFGIFLLETKGFAEAEPLLRECLAIREKNEPEAWTKFNTLSQLGGALLGQKNYADAEPLLLKGYEGLKAREKTIPPQGAIRLPEAVDRLIELYSVMSKPEAVQKWQAERAQYPLPTTSAATAEK